MTTAKPDAHVKPERRKGTWGIPLTQSMLTLSIALLGWFGNDKASSIEKHFDIIDQHIQKYEDETLATHKIIFQSLSDEKSKRSNDIACLWRNIGQCCDGKANVSC